MTLHSKGLTGHKKDYTPLSVAMHCDAGVKEESRGVASNQNSVSKKIKIKLGGTVRLNSAPVLCVESVRFLTGGTEFHKYYAFFPSPKDILLGLLLSKLLNGLEFYPWCNPAMCRVRLGWDPVQDKQ